MPDAPAQPSRSAELDAALEPAPTPDKRLQRLGAGCFFVFFLMLCLSIAVPLSIVFDYYPRFRPSASERHRVERVLKAYASEQWGDRATLERLEVALEREGSDYPLNHEWREYRYFAYFRVTGTKAVFAASLPMGLTTEDIGSWWQMTTPLTGEDVALLTAYAEVTDLPAGMWGRDAYGLDAQAHPGAEIWRVQPLARGQVFSTGGEGFAFERRADGTFAPIESVEQ